MPTTLTSEQRGQLVELAALRARVRAGAERVANESHDFLRNYDALRVLRPPRDYRGGEYDWLERLDPMERARLSRWWSDSRAHSVDNIAEQLRVALPRLQDVSDDEIMRTVWLAHTRIIDAATTTARGRFPRGRRRRYSGAVDVRMFAPDVEADGYDIALVMGDDAEALEHLAAVDAGRDVDDAYRALGAATACRYGPAPWTMTADAYEHECRTILAQLAGHEDLTMTRRETVRRHDELEPAGVDTGQDYPELHADIVAAAIHAGIITLTTVRLAAVAAVKRGKRGPKRTSPCGSVSAWQAHQRNHEPVDAACAAAWAARQRDYYAARKARKSVAA